MPGLGEPEPLVVLRGQGHGSIEADDREHPGNMENGPGDSLAHFWVEVVQLGSVVPGGAAAVIAMVDVAGPAGAMIIMLEDHCRVPPLPVAVFNLQADIR